MRATQPNRRVKVTYYNLATVMAIAYRIKTPEAEQIIRAIWLAIMRKDPDPCKPTTAATVQKLRRIGLRIA